ncbi:MAG: hypothetical protein AMJ65_11025 [Phycisphaerae bacterium SG8_4]|nr:MAG: hypothetical protein AMJ65_11025 [Phycisphaerae bacterium SG8_4]
MTVNQRWPISGQISLSDASCPLLLQCSYSANCVNVAHDTAQVAFVDSAAEKAAFEPLVKRCRIGTPKTDNPDLNRS